MPQTLLPYLLVTLAPLFWAGNFVLARALHQSLPPIALSFWRWSLAGLLLLPFAYPALRAQRALLLSHWKILSWLGLLGVTNFNTFVYLGLQTTTATNAVLLQSVTPLLILALSVPLLGQPVRAPQGLGILLSLGGVLAIVARGDPGTLQDLGLNRGDLWVLAAAASWALYSVCLYWRPRDLDPLAFLGATVIAGTLPLLPLYLWDLWRNGGFDVNPVSLGAILYVALFPSLLAYLFWNRAVAELGASRTGQFMHLMPLFGALLAVLLLGEQWHAYHLTGAGLIATGIWLGSRRPKT